MNNSREVNNSSGGFVYFDNSYSSQPRHNSIETEDFLSFDTDGSFSSSNGNSFSPSNCSSPRCHYNQQISKSRGKKSYYSSRDSPLKLNQMGKSSLWRKKVGHTGNSNLAKDVSIITDGDEKLHNQSRTKYHYTASSPIASNFFFDPTCLKDPWFELEKTFLRTDNDNKSSDGVHVDLEEISEIASSCNSDSEEDSEGTEK